MGDVVCTIDVEIRVSGNADHQSTSGGAVYIRWGRKTCPGNGTDLLYWGKYFKALNLQFGLASLMVNSPFSSRSFGLLPTHQDLRCNLDNTNAFVFMISFRSSYVFSVFGKSKKKHHGLIYTQLAPRIKHKPGDNPKATANFENK